MRSFALTGALAALSLVGAATGPAAAQTLPVELVLTPPQRSSDRGPLAEATARIALTPAPLPTRFQPARPSADAAGKAAPAAGAISAGAAEPRTPRAPADPSPPMALQEPVTVAAKPIAAAGPATSPAPAVAPRQAALTNQEIVTRANAFFTNLKTLVADFTQIGADGRRIGGTLYLQRPGKVRFEYDKPSTLEVVADGSSVAVRDTKLATQDLYSISQTPLKFLLRDRVNLGQDIKITGIATENDGVRISLEDSSTLGGTSRITLYFDPSVETLTQWRIVDAQGYQTVVVLTKTDRPQRVDQSLFVINYDRAITTDTNR